MLCQCFGGCTNCSASDTRLLNSSKFYTVHCQHLRPLASPLPTPPTHPLLPLSILHVPGVSYTLFYALLRVPMKAAPPTHTCISYVRVRMTTVLYSPKLVTRPDQGSKRCLPHQRLFVSGILSLPPSLLSLYHSLSLSLARTLSFSYPLPPPLSL